MGMFARISGGFKLFVVAAFVLFAATLPALAATATVFVHKDRIGIGQTSQVTITFSEAVTGFTIGHMVAQDATLSGLFTADNTIYTATLTPNPGVNSSGNTITLTTPGVDPATSNSYIIDSNRPVAIITLSPTDLKAGETSLVTFTFSEAVTDLPLLALNIQNGSLIQPSSADGGITWTSIFTPSNDRLAPINHVSLDNTRISDLAGNTGLGTTQSQNYSVNTIRPTAALTVANPALRLGTTSSVTITFSEAVSGFSNAALTVENGTLSPVSSADGGITWTATLSPAPTVEERHNRITLDNTAVRNAAGNAGSGTITSNDYSVDTQRPTASVLVINPALQPSDSTQVIITFSEAVVGLDLLDFNAPNGTLSALSTSDNITYSVTFTPVAGITSVSNHVSLALGGVADQAGNAGSGSVLSNAYSVNVPTLSPASGALPSIFAGTAYSQAFTAAGGLGGYGFTSSGTLPPGLSLSPAGVLSGTPTAVGSFSFSITLTAAGGYTSAPYAYTLDVVAASPVVQDVTANVAYGSGDNPVALQISGGGVTGVSIDTYPTHGTATVNGLSISYTPAAGYHGPDSFTYTASNAGGTSAPARVSITVTPPNLAIGPDALPNGTLGQAYDQTLTASGGLAPYALTISAGALPPGLSLSNSGRVNGVPTGIGSYAFTITATDAGGQSASRAYNLLVEEDIAAVRKRFDQLGQGFVEARVGLLSSGVETPGLRSRSALSGRPGTVTANTVGNSQVLGFTTSLAEISAAGGAAEALAQGGAAELQPFNVWLDTRLTLHARTDKTEHWGDFALASLGADYRLADNVLVGLALYGDWMSDLSEDSTVRGTGFLTGPYVSVGLGQSVTFDASLFYGQSWNDITSRVLGLDYAGRFETDRLLLKAKLEGSWTADLLTIRPNATFFLMNERAGDYTVSAPGGMAIAVPGFDKTDYRLGLGATFEYAYLLDNGLQLTPQLGLSLASGGALDAGLFNQAYGKLSAGLALSDEAWQLGGKIDLDLSTTTERSISASGTFRLAF